MELGVSSGALSNVGLYRNNASANYPYNIGSAINITSSSATSAPYGYYYFYYDIEVEIPCEGIVVNSTWDCDGQGNCIDPGNGNGQYSSLSQCELICFTQTWDCDPINGCFSLNDGLGQFSDSLSCANDCQLVSVMESHNTIDIHPNPSKGHFEINTTSVVNKITVYNKLGEQILSVKNKKSFDLSYFNSGIYFVTLTTINKEIRTKVIKN